MIRVRTVLHVVGGLVVSLLCEPRPFGLEGPRLQLGLGRPSLPGHGAAHSWDQVRGLYHSLQPNGPSVQMCLLVLMPRLMLLHLALTFFSSVLMPVTSSRPIFLFIPPSSKHCT